MDVPSLDNVGLRKFGLVTGAIVVVLFGLAFPWIFSWSGWPVWPWVLAILLWVPALFFPIALRPVYTTWMRVGHVLGWINTRIILSLLFYVMVFPMGLIMRMFGKDPMAKKFDDTLESYRVKSVREPNDRLEKPY